MNIYYVNFNFLSKSSIYELQVLLYQRDYDDSVKKVNQHICLGYFVIFLLLVYTKSLSAEFM